ncbi:hypothetical protein TNCV_2985191 [Trichonephila clavipes]|nr:hypothetical protein TNCV_2985191 [Trichonephila clavipes]
MSDEATTIRALRLSTVTTGVSYTNDFRWSQKSPKELRIGEHGSQATDVSNPLEAEKSSPSPFDLSAYYCHKPGLYLQTTVLEKFPGSPEDEQEKQGESRDNTVLIRVEIMIESTTNSNDFRSKDGTVVKIPDADFNIIPRSVTKYTTPCSTRIQTTTICINNQGLIG